MNWQGHCTIYMCLSDCGKRGNQVHAHVIGGDVTNRNDWPWHTAIYARQSDTSDFTYICGGVLVNPYEDNFVIITAAHCLSTGQGPRDPTNVKILLGANFSMWEKNDGISGVQRHHVNL